MYADKIRELRLRSGMSQQALGSLLGVSAVSVGKWERGQTQPDIGTLTRLADIFNTTIDDLCRGLRPVSPLPRGVGPDEESRRAEGATRPADRPPTEATQADTNITVMTRAFRQLTPEEQEKYLAVGRALFAHAFSENGDR